MKIPRAAPLLLLAGLLAALSPLPAAAQEAPLRGQVLYVPVYSEIPYGEARKALPLTATLSVRNTDRKSPVTLRRLDYHDSAGRLVRSYLAGPRTLGPLSSAEYVVAESDRRGGVSASFLAEWTSDAAVSPPVLEAVMISTRSGQGISFTSPARVLEERR